MSRVLLLDCTLRDGGYVNNWNFGYETIKGFVRKIEETRIEFFEIGFLKNISYNRNKNLFCSLEQISEFIYPKKDHVKYVAMIDINDKIPIDKIKRNDGSSIDGIRVIFKKNNIDEAFLYCKELIKLGYLVFVQFVSTNTYSDSEFIEAINLFNSICPYAISVVDTFGLMKKDLFLRLIKIADENLNRNIALGYHAHNNLQQAQSNSEVFVELNLDRDIIIDGCVFGMGRGAGNLNLELFAGYLNDNHGSNYLIEPMLEIMDEYLNDIYKQKFWGYSLPLYLSAINECHPNYAIYLAEKNCLTEKSFNELLKQISIDDKLVFSKEKADMYYLEYQKNFIDDSSVIDKLTTIFSGKNVLLIAPGKSIIDYRDRILEFSDCIIVSLNFKGLDDKSDYIFCSNMKRYVKIEDSANAQYIITSNMREAKRYDFMINFSSYICNHSLIIDNSGIMALKFLSKLCVKKVYIAGMDGYSDEDTVFYADKDLEYDFSSIAEVRNRLISKELLSLSHNVDIEFITPTRYKVEL